MSIILSPKAPLCLENSELNDGHVILPRAAVCGIGGGIDTGKRTEIIGKMRLVVVSTAEGQLRPRHVHAVVQSSHGGLKTAYAAPHFGTHTDLFAKYLRESALAYSYGSGALGNAEGFFPEDMQRLIDQFRTPCVRMKMQTSGQENFQGPQFLDRCRNLAQPVDERRASPDLFQTDRALKKQVGTLAEQPCKTSRPDQNPDHLFHIRRIHYPVSCSRTDDDGWRKAPVCLSILSAVGEIAAG